jgi:hypothetical protein
LYDTTLSCSRAAPSERERRRSDHGQSEGMAGEYQATFLKEVEVAVRCRGFGNEFGSYRLDHVREVEGVGRQRTGPSVRAGRPAPRLAS